MTYLGSKKTIKRAKYIDKNMAAAIILSDWMVNPDNIGGSAGWSREEKGYVKIDGRGKSVVSLDELIRRGKEAEKAEHNEPPSDEDNMCECPCTCGRLGYADQCCCYCGGECPERCLVHGCIGRCDRDSCVDYAIRIFMYDAGYNSY